MEDFLLAQVPRTSHDYTVKLWIYSPGLYMLISIFCGLIYGSFLIWCNGGGNLEPYLYQESENGKMKIITTLDIKEGKVEIDKKYLWIGKIGTTYSICFNSNKSHFAFQVFSKILVFWIFCLFPFSMSSTAFLLLFLFFLHNYGILSRVLFESYYYMKCVT